MRVLADTLTASRLGLALIIVWLGFTGGIEALDKVTFIILLGWTTDALDGHAARRDRSGRPTWFNHNDVTVDTIFVISSLFYLTWSGWIPWAFSLIYMIVGGLLLYYFYSRSLLIALEIPAGLLPVIVAFAEKPLLGWAYIGWAVLAFALDHRRFFIRLRLFFTGWTLSEQVTSPNLSSSQVSPGQN